MPCGACDRSKNSNKSGILSEMIKSGKTSNSGKSNVLTSRRKNSKQNNGLPYRDIAEFNYDTEPKTLLNYNEVFTEGKTLGKGGFGRVVKVTDQTGKPYALKILLEADPDVLVDETAALMKLSAYPNCNENTVCYYDVFQFEEDGDMVYGILTDFIDGDDLTKHKLSQELIFEIARWLTGVIANLHDAGFVHRDIKPNNIMWDKNSEFVKLIDFGLACRRRVGRKGVPYECKGDTAGTPAFMSPELLQSELIDENNELRPNYIDYYKAGDVYSIGATIYNLLSINLNDEDELPYKFNKFEVPVGKYRSLNGNVDEDFEVIVQSMVDLDMNERITADEAYNQLTELGIAKGWIDE